jgi:tRNA pseudouridine55 synthase
VNGSGLVLVDKPAGITSHDVVGRVRRVAGTRKVGHAGTLDPMATGVLVLGVNRATRLLGHLTLEDKTYDATVRLGQTTVTDDAEGEVVATAPASEVAEAAVRDALAAFSGEIAQVPSAVSAVKVGGQRSYKRVRAGEQVELAPRLVTIHRLEVRGFRRDGDLLDVDVTVTCSSGTYVRAIARDLGAALGVGGHLTALRRTAVGDLRADETHPLDVLERAGDPHLLGMPELARRFFPHTAVDAATARAVAFGQKLELTLPAADRPVALTGPDGDFLALYRQDGRLAVPVAVFVS